MPTVTTTTLPGHLCGNGAANACGSIAGQVVNVATKTPLAGVAVSTSNGRSASTDDYGFYSFDGLATGSLVVKFVKKGYATNYKRVQVSTGQAVPLPVLMKEAGTPQIVNAAAGGTFSAGDSLVRLTGGSLRAADGHPVTGEVELVVTKADASTGDVMSFPGSFERAIDTGGQMVQLDDRVHPARQCAAAIRRRRGHPLVGVR